MAKCVAGDSPLECGLIKIMINHLTGGPPDTPTLTLGVGLGRFHVTLQIHRVSLYSGSLVGSSHGPFPKHDMHRNPN